MTSVRPVQLEWSELAHEVVRCPPDLYMGIMARRYETAVWWEPDSANRFLKVEVVQNGTAAEVDKECSSILVDGQKNVAIGTKSDGSDIFPVFEWKCIWFVTIKMLTCAV